MSFKNDENIIEKTIVNQIEILLLSFEKNISE